MLQFGDVATPSNLPKARTIARAFTFIDVFMVTLRPIRARTNSAMAASDLIGGAAELALECARMSEIERFRDPEGC